jgi:NMD protein affecting ribosome stability and mRNA decay
MAKDACLECGHTDRKIMARGLCKSCYYKNFRRGTLGRYDLVGRCPEHMADAAYVKWLHGDRVANGAKGWSGLGIWCGDGALGYTGCGSSWHEHRSDGLCDECYRIEVLGEDIECRDVRLSRGDAA